MRKMAFAFVLLLSAAAFAEQYPKAVGYVNDFAQLFSKEQAESLNKELAAFEKKTTIEIVVVAVSGLNNQGVETYARELGTEWGVGKRNKDNGIVFLVAPKERKMRIETASGIRSILTNSRVDQIRDQVIIPRSRAGDMAGGIIEGAREIMRTLDVLLAAQTEGTVPKVEEENDASAPSRDESAQTETNLDSQASRKGDLLWALVSLVSGGVAGYLLTSIWRDRARKYVLRQREGLMGTLATIRETAQNPDVKKQTRDKSFLENRVAEFEILTETSKCTNWSEKRRRLNQTKASLEYLLSEMQSEINYAEEARREGPQLMERLSERLAAAEAKIATGTQSQVAAERLAAARKEFDYAQSIRSQSSVIDWLILYAILSDAQTNVGHAESAHEEANVVQSDWGSQSAALSSMGNTVDTTPSIDPGGGGVDLGGGGGFDGGGSSGDL